MLDKILDIIMTILPFLGGNRKKRKEMAQEVKEFSRTGERSIFFSNGTIGKGVEGLFRP